MNMSSFLVVIERYLINVKRFRYNALLTVFLLTIFFERLLVIEMVNIDIDVHMALNRCSMLFSKRY